MWQSQYSLYRLLKDGDTKILTNDAGDRVTPAVVAYTQHEKVLNTACLRWDGRRDACHLNDFNEIVPHYKDHESKTVFGVSVCLSLQSYHVIISEANSNFPKLAAMK